MQCTYEGYERSILSKRIGFFHVINAALIGWSINTSNIGATMQQWYQDNTHLLTYCNSKWFALNRSSSCKFLKRDFCLVCKWGHLDTRVNSEELIEVKSQRFWRVKKVHEWTREGRRTWFFSEEDFQENDVWLWIDMHMFSSFKIRVWVDFSTF